MPKITDEEIMHGIEIAVEFDKLDLLTQRILETAVGYSRAVDEAKKRTREDEKNDSEGGE